MTLDPKTLKDDELLACYDGAVEVYEFILFGNEIKRRFAILKNDYALLEKKLSEK